MMLNSLKIRNFRALEDFEVAKLGRVNLIVGKNNSGKSSVLEALRIYAGNAQLSLLETISAGHDEKYRLNESEREEQDAPLPFEDFFTGRRFPAQDGKAIEIGDPTTNQMLQIEHGYYIEWQENNADDSGEDSYRIRRKRVQKAELDLLAEEIPNHALFVQRGERVTTLHFRSGQARIRSSLSELAMTLTTPCSVIPTRFISVDELADEWDKIALTDNQEIVKEALQIISADFLDITFVRNEDKNAGAAGALSRSAKVRLDNHARPVPLNSLGDGMLSVLQLVLKAFPAKGGVLLIDEFENGLHYSVQENVWQLVFELASKLDIQVFATTHSWDCIESFAKVAKDRKDIEGVLFRVGRSVRTSDMGRVIATVFDEEQLFNITQADVEVR